MSADAPQPLPQEEPAALLCFRAGGLGFAVPVHDVRRSSYLVAAQPIPDGPDYLVGVTAVGAQTVALVDLAGRLGLDQPARYGLETPVVWLQSGARSAGFVVDEVVGVREAARSDMGDDFKLARTAIRGVAQAAGEGWLVLGTERLLDFDFSRAGSELALDAEELRRRLMAAAQWDGNGDS